MKEAALSRWAELVGIGTSNAMVGLSQMIGQEIEVDSFGLRKVPVHAISQLVGGPDAPAVGIYLTVSGAADGHLMLIYDPRIAFAFVDLLMMQPIGTTDSIGELESSALGEMGNVIGAFFLNAIADNTGLSLRPSPPAVMTDMAGALLDVVSSEILLQGDETYLAETTFSTAEGVISGVFLVMPSDELLSVLVGAAKAA